MPAREKIGDTARDDLSVDEVYLRVWEKQQEWTATRWGVITFFLSISFALFGLSLQGQTSLIGRTLQRVSGLAIYWFTYLVFRRYNDWSSFLRAYLEELEQETSTRFRLQARWKSSKQVGVRRWTSVSKLLAYFGLVYAVAVALLWWTGI